MINLKKLGLHEITFQEYKELCGYLDAHTRNHSKHGRGYALIDQPLSFPDFKMLLCEFRETEFARRASFKRNERWERIAAALLKDEVIDDIVASVQQTGFIYLHFAGAQGGKGFNHEIGFDKYDNQVMSQNIDLPGYLRSRYNWRGSNTPYCIVTGIWAPEHIARERCPSLTTTLTSPQLHQSPNHHQDQ